MPKITHTVTEGRGPRLQITEGMRRILDYPKFSGPTRLLILETNYFFEQSWRRAAQTLGWRSATVPSAMVGALTRDDIHALFITMAEFKPDFILASNYAGIDTEGMFSRFFEDARIPYVSWFTDTPRMILYDRKIHASYYAVAATWERSFTRHFEELGFQHIHYMPLATDPALFTGPPGETYERRLAFVGSSMIQQVNEAWEKLEHLPEIVRAILDAFNEGRVTRDRFAQGVGAILPPALLEERTVSERRHIELCILYEATRRQRAEMALALESLGVEIRGDPAWSQVVPRAGGPVGYFSDLAPFYRHTAVNLNTTSLQMKTAVNQRVFDCPAAGGFLITDAQSDLADLFDMESEVTAYASMGELEDKVKYYTRNPAQRIPIILRAQKRIADCHTHRHRLATLETYLRERFA